MKSAPIKRSESLKPLSREHHYGLLLSWKIKTGLKKSISLDRIKNYAVWFFENSLKQHFKNEEEYVFPVLGNSHPLIIQAISEHRELERLIKDDVDVLASLHSVAELIEKHIRFEERELFNEVEKILTEKEIDLINKYHEEINELESYEDEFWK